MQGIDLERGSRSLGYSSLTLITEGCVNEALLFHSARNETVPRICEHGFDAQRGGENTGALFGVGTYFAHNASKSMIYAASRLASRIIVARVLLGHTFYADAPRPELKRPPIDATGRQCNSLTALTRRENGCVDHSEYVVYKDSQAMPLAVIDFSHQTQCICHMCSP